MTETASVSIARAAGYRPEEVRRALRQLLEPLGGMEFFVRRGDRVLVKPNFLSASNVDSAVCTHPEVILAVCEEALDAGAAQVVVGDSPGLGSGLGVARKLGLATPARALGVAVMDFATPVVVENRHGVRFKRFELERTVLEVDKIINLAKVKTHQQMFLTLAVKNTFGCVVGVRKAAWHLEAGRDAALFADMLLDLHYLVAPALNILDGIVMMEGNGPGSGTPRHLGALVASADGVAADRVVCEQLLNLPLDQLYTDRAAVRAGLGAGATDTKLVVCGVEPAELAIHGVAHPHLEAVGDMVGPRFLRRLTRRLFELRPVVRRADCTGCAICQRACPAHAIDLVDRRGADSAARIAPNLCIHCYCCQEVCPEGAIVPRRGFVRRLMTRVQR